MAILVADKFVNNMTKYNFPNLTNSNILYKGRRYVAITTSATESINNSSECVQFIVWDGLYDVEVSSGATSAEGSFIGVLSFSHVEIGIQSSRVREEFGKSPREILKELWNMIV